VEAVRQIERLRCRVDDATADEHGVVLGGLLAHELEARARILVDVGGIVRDRELAERGRPLLLLLVAQALPMFSERLLRHEVEVEGLFHRRLQPLESAGIAELFGLRQDVDDRSIEPLDRLRRRLLCVGAQREHRQDERGDGGHMVACRVH